MAYLAKLFLLMCFLEAYTFAQVRIYRDFRYPVVNSFNVYWNVPTYMCQKFNIDFEPHLKKYGIVVNSNDAFRGEHIAILYDPGLFPAMIKDTSTGKLNERNGGIPQLGDIDAHLQEFAAALDKAVPRDFSGVGIIDFEAWRPSFRQNWNDQTIYRNMSIRLERQKHPGWNDKQIMEAAKRSFEGAARLFMQETLKMAKRLRPNALWGYYGFPYCYNSGKQGSESCPVIAQRENNEIQWLYDESTGFYPSIYSSNKLSTAEHRTFVIGRLNEAWRMASRVSRNYFPQVYPYVWYRYHDSQTFLPKEKMFDALEMTRRYRMGGAIIWGSSSDLRTAEKCQALLDYVNDVLGPTVLRVKQNRNADIRHDGIDEYVNYGEEDEFADGLVDDVRLIELQ